MNSFEIECGMDTYNFNKAFYFWAVEVFGEHLTKVYRKPEDDTIVLVVSDDMASDIPFFRERCGYGLSA